LRGLRKKEPRRSLERFVIIASVCVMILCFCISGILDYAGIMRIVPFQERQQAEEEAKMKEAELMRGNPLININNVGSFSVKRR
jgi:hypothetical protein